MLILTGHLCDLHVYHLYEQQRFQQEICEGYLQARWALTDDKTVISPIRRLLALGLPSSFLCKKIREACGWKGTENEEAEDFAKTHTQVDTGGWPDIFGVSPTFRPNLRPCSFPASPTPGLPSIFQIQWPPLHAHHL